MEPSVPKFEQTVLIARPPDGKVYRRVDKKQLITPWLENGTDFYHWCNAQSPERITAATPTHVCDIWEETEPEPEPKERKRKPPLPTIEDLMERVSYTQETISIDPVPTLDRARTLASLYQALALDTQARALDTIAATLDQLQRKARALENISAALEQLQRTLDNQAVSIFKIGAALDRHFKNRVYS